MIKICGLHRVEDLKLAENLGADVIEWFMGSLNHLEITQKNEIKALLEAAKVSKTAVLFRNAELEPHARSFRAI